MTRPDLDRLADHADTIPYTLTEPAAELTRLREAVAALVDEWEYPHREYALRKVAVPALRALLGGEQ